MLTSELPLTKICELKPFNKGINCIFIVLEPAGQTITKENVLISHYSVADQSAFIKFSLWEAHVLSPGDIIRLTGGFTTLFKKHLVLNAGVHAIIERIGQYNLLFNETLDMSITSWVSDPTSNKNFKQERIFDKLRDNFLLFLFQVLIGGITNLDNTETTDTSSSNQ